MGSFGGRSITLFDLVFPGRNQPRTSRRGRIETADLRTSQRSRLHLCPPRFRLSPWTGSRTRLRRRHEGGRQTRLTPQGNGKPRGPVGGPVEKGTPRHRGMPEGQGKAGRYLGEEGKK